MKTKPLSKDKQRLQDDIQRALRDVGVRDPIAQRQVLEHSGRASELSHDSVSSAPFSGSVLSPIAPALPIPHSPNETSVAAKAVVSDAVYEISLDAIVPSPDQPRTTVNPKADDELVESIRVHGVWQPIQVRPIGNDRYELIAGHRRWKAAGRAGLQSIPSLIRQHTDASAASQALIDNLIREDLSPLEEARALQSLIKNHGFEQQEVAAKIGCDPTRISRALSILRLPSPILEEFFSPGSAMTMKHAEALLPLLNQSAKLSRLARKAKEEHWSSAKLREASTRIPRVNQGPQNVRIIWKVVEGETLGFTASIRFSRNQSDKIPEIREEAQKILRFLEQVESNGLVEE